MIRSMTGYGRTDAGEVDSRFTIEVRSLNNRYLDVQIKAPRDLAVLEPRMKKAVQDSCFRGRFEIYISRNNNNDKVGKLTADEKLVEQYISILRDLKKNFDLKGDVDLSMVAGFHGVVALTEERGNADALWQVLSSGLSQVLDELNHMRATEGAVLGQDIRARLDIIERISAAVRSQAPVTVENARKRMSDTLNRILNEQPDPPRLAQEIAILAERTDVTEELTRLNSHVRQFRILMEDQAREAVGRKLDFLLQEMGREVNTIASKAMDAQISLDIVNMKAELEKIREQVQNIE